ncbi:MULTISPECIES: glycosyltransferase family 2 protein [Sphingobacterium]|uniref:glycosyltransferase family 2 protein n=1 Tax=Sphingobacterium TaxID=28453 RepID=UPI0013DC647F|nr:MULTISPECIES: glycosyltransferase family 2 protein [unclassified Sphingobacterium]
MATYIILLNYNGIDDTIECVKSLQGLSNKDFRIIIVDNKSTTHTIDELASKLGTNIQFVSMLELSNMKANNRVVLIESDRNGGFAYGNNLGIRFSIQQSDCEYVWLLNNDTIVDENILNELIDSYETKKAEGIKVGIIGSKLIHYYDRNSIQSIGWRFNKYFGFPKQIGANIPANSLDTLKYKGSDFSYVAGASMFVSKSYIQDVGGLNDKYFLYFEEIDWTLRGNQLGYKLEFCPRALVYHKEGASTKDNITSSLASPFSDYHFTRSKILFCKKFYPLYLPLYYLSFILVILNRIRRGQFKNITSISKAMIGSRLLPNAR